MKALLIAHGCQVSNEGQQRAQQLGALPGVDLHVVAPDRWHEYGTWRRCTLPENPTYTFHEEKVRWPWSGPGQWYLHHYPGLTRLIRTLKPDIINLWEEAWGLVSVQACYLRNRILPEARIVSETEANINRAHPFPFSAFRRYTLRNTDYAVARQTEGVGVLRAKGYRGPIEVIGNAVDADLFRPLDREACKRRLGLSGFVAGYIGRFIEAKGLIDFIEALPMCAPETNALFVGAGPFEDQIKRRIGELGLAARVRFLPPRRMADLPEIMNAMDTLLLVSRTTATWKEQFGRVIIEAHACCTPVIGSSSGAIPEIVGEGGLVVPEGNPQALAEALEKLRIHAEMRCAMGRLGRVQVERNFTWRAVAERMRDIYLKVLSGENAGAGEIHHGIPTLQNTVR